MRTSCSLIALMSLLCACAAQPDRQPQDLPDASQMQARMQEMRGLMARIHGAPDPAERQRLMVEHMQSMREGMTMMSRMKGGCMGGEHMAMMQMMMGQMMDHMEAQPADPEGSDTPAGPRQGRREAPSGQQGGEHEAHH